MPRPDWDASADDVIEVGGGDGPPFGEVGTGVVIDIADPISVFMPIPDDPIDGRSPCCAPWSEQDIPTALQPVFPTNAASPYTMQYLDPAALNAQMGAYLNYVHAMAPSITTITMRWDAVDLGNSASPTMGGPQTGGAQTVTWTWTPNGVQTAVAGGGFWTGAPFQVNRWYGFVTRLSHNGTPNSIYFDDDCLNNTWMFRWSSQGMRVRGGGSGQYETINANGRVVKSGRIRVTPGRAVKLPVARERPRALPRMRGQSREMR